MNARPGRQTEGEFHFPRNFRLILGLHVDGKPNLFELFLKPLLTHCGTAFKVALPPSANLPPALDDLNRGASLCVTSQRILSSPAAFGLN